MHVCSHDGLAHRLPTPSSRGSMGGLSPASQSFTRSLSVSPHPPFRPHTAVGKVTSRRKCLMSGDAQGRRGEGGEHLCGSGHWRGREGTVTPSPDFFLRVATCHLPDHRLRGQVYHFTAPSSIVPVVQHFLPSCMCCCLGISRCSFRFTGIHDCVDMKLLFFLLLSLVCVLLFMFYF